MQNYQKKKFDKKKKNTENIFPYIIFSNISEKLMAENILCAFKQHHTFAAKVGLSTLLALEEIRETLTCDSYKDNIEIYVDEAIDEGCRLTVMKMQTKRIDIVKVNHQLCGFVAFVKQLLSKADLIQGYYVPLIPKFVDGKLFLEIDYAEEVELTDKGKEYLTYVPNPNTCVKPTKEDLDTYANICIELAQYIVDKYKDQ